MIPTICHLFRLGCVWSPVQIRPPRPTISPFFSRNWRHDREMIRVVRPVIVVGSPRGSLPEAPTHPDVRYYRIRLFGARLRYGLRVRDHNLALNERSIPRTYFQVPAMQCTTFGGPESAVER